MIPTPQDTTLATGVLTRLDAVAAKLGVAADQLWDLWVRTGPLLTWTDVGLTAIVGFMLYRLNRWLAKGYKAENGKGAYGDETPWMIGAILTGVGAVLCGVATVVSIRYAIIVTVEPRLYAIDQLKELLGK